MAHPAIDVDAVHALLYWRSANGVLRVKQTDLAADLGVTRFTVNRLLRRMVDERRLTPLDGRAGSASPVYEVTDPAAWTG